MRRKEKGKGKRKREKEKGERREKELYRFYSRDLENLESLTPNHNNNT
jgi:hypothetical protein